MENLFISELKVMNNDMHSTVGTTNDDAVFLYSKFRGRLIIVFFARKFNTHSCQEFYVSFRYQLFQSIKSLNM